MLSLYPACFYHDEDGYSVIFPDLNWLSTCGSTLEEAMAMAIDCLAGYLYSSKRDGEKVPKPSSMKDIDLAAIAKELDPDSPMGEAFVNMISVDVAAYAKEHFKNQLKRRSASRRGLTKPHWSKI